MTGGINHIQHIVGIPHLPRHSHCLGFNSDSPFAFNIHPIQILFPHFSFRDHPGVPQHAISQRRLAVINMGDDTKITNPLGIRVTGGNP